MAKHASKEARVYAAKNCCGFPVFVTSDIKRVVEKAFEAGKESADEALRKENEALKAHVEMLRHETKQLKLQMRIMNDEDQQEWLCVNPYAWNCFAACLNATPQQSLAAIRNETLELLGLAAEEADKHGVVLTAAAIRAMKVEE